ncbi:MAG: KpsF/GutQ family sugar-phosphate isomerase [Planctomycetaceae bacterium]|nr:KpsF/GutQ family sugar-phosphate isomerase [Planctomycetaceae bacterium]
MSQAAAQAVVPYARVEQLREARSIVAHEGQALVDLSRRLDTTFCDAIERIADCRGCVVVTGVGKAGLIGQKIAATMSSTGTRAFFLHPTEAFHGDLGSLGAEDIMLLLSHSGESDEVCRLLPWVRSLGLPMIAITGEAHSTLARAADITIALGRLIEAGLHGLPPTTSTTAMLAVGDALALVVAQSRGFTPQQFGRLHPGGSLGRRLTPVKEVMRRGDEMRLSVETASVREVLTGLQRPGRRTGAVILVDEQGHLSGLFTDSDLARLLEQRRDDQLDRPIVEVMTARPITIRDDAILEEAVGLLSARRLSELPVVDHEHRPVGLLDITDVIGLMPAEG